MYAVIKTGGTQQRVVVGDTIYVDKLDLEDGSTVNFDVLMVSEDDETVQVGTPLVEGYKVSGTVNRQVKGKKVLVFKMKAKKNYRRTRGHRQPYTQVEINYIGKEA